MVVLCSVGSALLSVWNAVWPIAVALLLFGLVVVVHELGHFLFAKRKNRENAEKTQAATHTKNTQGNWALCQLAAFQGFVKWQKKCKNSTLPKEM